ncbi:hypothetical protein [Nocardioides rubriscoriae]|uniref:hypothetical protein n=1 Tax=Nocardioides rubriscoriae TaxID=642762 RepID=UPI0011DF6C30|nr:hypothetical protein [Nocardioides rubriscoriae]
MTDTVTRPRPRPWPRPWAPGPRTGRGRPLVLLVAGAVLVLGLAVVAWRAVADDHRGAEGGAATVPYDDPQAAGGITLCSDDGTAVTGGSIDDRPFADLAVGETGLPGTLDPAGAVATLFGYQPRAGVGADEFSGIPLTAAGTVVDPQQPTVRVTDQVYSVGDFVAAFPATDDGFVQLRLYLGTPEAGTLTESSYDTADLRVDGDRWELVHGGSASCSAAASLVPSP